MICTYLHMISSDFFFITSEYTLNQLQVLFRQICMLSLTPELPLLYFCSLECPFFSIFSSRKVKKTFPFIENIVYFKHYIQDYNLHLILSFQQPQKYSIILILQSGNLNELSKFIQLISGSIQILILYQGSVFFPESDLCFFKKKKSMFYIFTDLARFSVLDKAVCLPFLLLCFLPFLFPCPLNQALVA